MAATGLSVVGAGVVGSGGPGRTLVRAVSGVSAHGAPSPGSGPDVFAVALLAGLALWVAAHLVGTSRCAGRTPSLRGGVRRTGTGRLLAFLAAVAVLAAAVGPWAEPLAQRSLAAHMGQHMLLLVVAAPLLAAAAPGTPLVLVLPVGARRRVAAARYRLRRTPGLRGASSPLGAWLLSVVTLWLWHLPPLYEAALGSEVLHVLEHASFLLGAWAFWWYVLHEGPARLRGGAAVLFVFAATLPGAALGAVLTFAQAPLYPTQAAGAARAGLDPLTDQQLAGLVMWVPPDVVYLAVTVALVLPWLARLAGDEVGDEAADRRSPARQGGRARPAGGTVTGTRADRAHPGTVSRLVVAVVVASAAAVALLAGMRRGRAHQRCGRPRRPPGARRRADPVLRVRQLPHRRRGPGGGRRRRPSPHRLRRARLHRR